MIGGSLSACDGKHRFDDPATAEIAARRGKIKLQVYRCQSCRKWHVGGGIIPRHAARR